MTSAARAAEGPGGGADTVNLAGYSKASVARYYGTRQGYHDDGERIVFDVVAAEMRGKAILDLGVGGGRTIPIFGAVSDDYVAVDYSEAMVRQCRQLYPGVAVDVADARDLSGFADGSKDLVVFSCAGIDHVSHGDRDKILAEVRRVLRPGGAFVFSTHNLHGPGHGEKPWGSPREWRQPRHMAGLALWFPVNVGNHLRYRRFSVDGKGWSMRNAAFDHFTMVFHYTSAGRQVADLEAAGFQPGPAVYEGTTGQRLQPGEETDTWWLHFIARRP